MRMSMHIPFRLDEDSVLLQTVEAAIDQNDFFTSLLIEDACFDWTLARDLGRVLDQD